MEISVSIMLQIITVAITAVSLLTDYIYNLNVNKRNRTFDVVIQGSMDRMDKFRHAYSQILYYTHPYIIRDCREDNIKPGRFNSFYAYELNFARAEVRTNSWPFWPKEVSLHKKMDELCKESLAYYERERKSEKIEEKILKLRDEFFIECSIYDWALWEFNQHQANGQKISRNQLDKQYYSVLTRIHNSGSGHTLKFKEAFENVYDSLMPQTPQKTADNKTNKNKEGK